MFGDKKRFRASPVFDEASYQPPALLKKSLELIAGSFNNSNMRSLHLMDTSENQRLYGFITNYESSNFCWIQPTRTLNRTCEFEYHKYLKKINSDALAGRLDQLETYTVGTNCIAQYEVDNKWYRAIIVNEPEVQSQSQTWQVIFIDYGNFQYCRTNQIAAIVKQDGYNHFHAPMQAVCCRLYNIVPKLPQYRAEIDAELEEFYSKNSGTFLEIIVRNKRCDYIVDCDVFKCRTGSLGERRFFKKNIGQKLVDSGVATFADMKAAYAVLPQEPSPSNEIITLDDDNDEEDLKRKTQIKREVKVKVENKAFCNFVPDSNVNGNTFKREIKLEEFVSAYDTPPSTQTPIKVKAEPMIH